jgi:hypothetical protein
MKQAAIVLTTHYRRLTEDQEISLRHLQHHLGGHDTYLAMPEALDFHVKDFRETRFPDRCFESIKQYDQLLLSRAFYERFIDYEYILIYQLDCLVFSDELAEWCEKGYDYIGAPWFRSKTLPSGGPSRVGNGGFSLRKIESFIATIDSTRYMDPRVSLLNDMLRVRFTDVRPRNPVLDFAKKLQVARNVRKGCRWYRENYTLNEDIFWTDRAIWFNPGFTIAPVGEAVKFSFENHPRECFELNDSRLPFGCHAWEKWDRIFWEPHLMTAPRAPRATPGDDDEGAPFNI